jgi:GT2 family glycosyltransferase
MAAAVDARAGIRVALAWRVSDRTDAVAVIVVAHDSGATLADAVRRACAALAVAEVAIIDNASRDGSAEALRFAHAGDPRVRVVRNPDNPGFATACNQGAGCTRAPWLAFLNPDCLVETDTFERMLAIARGNPAIGLLGADVRDAMGAPEAAARRRDPTFRRVLAQAAGGEGLRVAPDPSQLMQPVDAVSGALMLVPRSLFERLGGFDVGYRLHCEDLDLCRRVRESGLAVAVAERVSVVHLKGGSSRRRPLFVAWHKHCGMWRYRRRFGGDNAIGAALAGVAIWARFAVQLPLLLVRALLAR